MFLQFSQFPPSTRIIYIKPHLHDQKISKMLVPHHALFLPAFQKHIDKIHRPFSRLWSTFYVAKYECINLSGSLVDFLSQLDCQERVHSEPNEWLYTKPLQLYKQKDSSLEMLIWHFTSCLNKLYVQSKGSPYYCPPFMASKIYEASRCEIL